MAFEFQLWHLLVGQSQASHLTLLNLIFSFEKIKKKSFYQDELILGLKITIYMKNVQMCTRNNKHITGHSTISRTISKVKYFLFERHQKEN